MVLQIERRWRTVLSVHLSSPAQVPAGSLQYSRARCSALLGRSPQLHSQKQRAPAHSADSGTKWESGSFPCNVQAPYFAPSAQKFQIFTSRVAKRCWRRMWGRAPNYRTETLYCLQLILVHSGHIACILLIIKC